MRRKNPTPQRPQPQRVLFGRVLPRGWTVEVGGSFPHEHVAVFTARGRLDCTYALPTTVDEQGIELRCEATSELMLDAILGADDVSLGPDQLTEARLVVAGVLGEPDPANDCEVSL